MSYSGMVINVLVKFTSISTKVDSSLRLPSGIFNLATPCISPSPPQDSAILLVTSKSGVSVNKRNPSLTEPLNPPSMRTVSTIPNCEIGTVTSELTIRLSKTRALASSE